MKTPSRLQMWPGHCAGSTWIDALAGNGAEVTVLTFHANLAGFTAGTAPTDDVQVGTA